MSLTPNRAPVTAQMLIRKPVATVFKAFTDPEITKNFWFTHGSDVLEKGKTVTWTWGMYNFSAEAFVEEMILNEFIKIQWGTPTTTIEFSFEEFSDDTTYVRIASYGYTQTGDDLIPVINDNTGGFTTVIDGAKAFLEHNINLNLIADKFAQKK